jgi:hypothetical protein
MNNIEINIENFNDNKYISNMCEIEIYLSTHSMILNEGIFNNDIIESMNKYLHDTHHPLNLIHQEHLFNIFIQKLYDNDQCSDVIIILNIIVSNIKDDTNAMRNILFRCLNLILIHSVNNNDTEIINKIFDFLLNLIVQDKINILLFFDFKNIFINACKFQNVITSITIYDNMKMIIDAYLLYEICCCALPILAEFNKNEILKHILKERYHNEINNNIIIKYFKDIMFKNELKLPFNHSVNIACQKGHVEIVEILINFYDDFIKIDRVDSPIIFRECVINACLNGNFNVIKFLENIKMINIQQYLFNSIHRTVSNEIVCAFSKSCYSGNIESLLNLINILEYQNFNEEVKIGIINKGIKHAINSNQYNIVELLLSYMKNNNLLKMNNYYQIY